MNPHLLETKNLWLKPLNNELAEQLTDDVLKLYSDEEIIKYSGFSLIHSADEARQLLQKYLTKSDFYIWMIFDKSNHQYIGDISLTVDAYHQFAFVGCFLHKNYWGKGLMFEAMKELLFYAFAEEGLHRVEAQVHELNVNSQHFFEKFGFVHEATLKQNFFVDGTFYDSKLFRFLFDEYMNCYGKMD